MSYQRAEGPGDVTLRFGQHRGKRLREVPVGYLEWLLTIELREPLRTAVHDLVQQLYRLAGGEGVDPLFAPGQPAATSQAPRT
jgi:uncharacterized protein (DUF3820 family)